MPKLNCWEYTRCGKEHGAAQPGACCPASTHESAHGVNDGECGGRLCWTVPGTHCRSPVSAAKDPDSLPAECARCGFVDQVRKDEGLSFQLREHPHSLAW